MHTANNIPSGFDEPPISRLDPQGVLLACNATYLHMSGFTEQELIGKPHEAINDPRMPAALIASMWRALHAGMPWTAPVMLRHKNGHSVWRSLYVVPLFDDGKLAALGTTYQPLDSQATRQAETLYARLARQQSPWSLAQRLHTLLANHGLQLALGLAVLLATLLAYLPVTLGAPLLLALLLAGLQPALRQRQTTRAILAHHRQAFSDPLLAPLHAQQADPSSQLAMALNSQRTRMSTVMSRICINSVVLRQQAQTPPCPSPS